MIKCIALLPIIQWLWQQGSILSVAWEKQEKQDDTPFSEEFKCEIKAKKQRTKDACKWFLFSFDRNSIEVIEYI